MSKPLVVILMGSKADLEHSTKIADACRQFGLETVARIGSAHKTPEHTLAILREYENDPRLKVYITVAGRSNALSGFVDGAVSAPVIACPPPSERLDRMDIFSSLRMPSGIASAVVLEPANAALLAAKILGQVDADVRKRVAAVQKVARGKIVGDDADIR
jgi:5-(carboxyamino)imidazole ribonucleotide mutase/phosphoribosylaminoimidazole-succinocarboxamide synthase